MQNDRAEAAILGALIVYIVAVSFAVSFFMSGQGAVLGINVFQFDRTYELSNESLTVENIGGIQDAGDWVFVNTTGLTSNTSGENRLLFALEPDANGHYTNEFTLSNPNQLSFDVFVKYYILLGVARYGTGYHFTPSGIVPFETGLLGETQYTPIPYSNLTDQFIRPLVKTSFYKSTGIDNPVTPYPDPTKAEITILVVNDVELHRFVTAESFWSYPMSSVYYSGLQVTGSGLSILRYRTTFESEPADWDSSVWGFIKTMGLIVGWTLPAEYFTSQLGLVLFAIINVIAIKIPLVMLGYILLRLGRGGG